MLPKPCIHPDCGDLFVGKGSRCDQHRLRPKRPSRTRKERNRPSQWDALSARLRRESPFCEWCNRTDLPLHADHIIPVSERPDLALEPLNCRILCQPHNSARSNRCTDAEREAVLTAIAARKRRANTKRAGRLNSCNTPPLTSTFAAETYATDPPANPHKRA